MLPAKALCYLEFSMITVLAASAALAAAAQESEVFVDTVDLGGGIYALITNRGGNVGVSVGEDGVFMIDTQFAPIAPFLDRAQRAVSGDAPVELVLNTHLHGDHVLGNGVRSSWRITAYARRWSIR